MSLIYGIISKNGQAVDPALLDVMINALPEYTYDRELHFQDECICVGKMLRFNTPESFYSSQPQSATRGKKTIVFDGRIDNRNALASQLSIPSTELATLPDEALVLMAYEQWEDACCAYLLGDFAFLICLENSVLIARDHVGARPLFISESNDFLAFASNKNALLALPWVSRKENSQWIADLLCLVKVDKDATYYQDISSFLPAHARSFRVGLFDETDNYSPYWTLNLDNTIELQTDEEYIETFRAILNESVACRIRSAFPVATELSGGLDSTTITAIANQLTNDISSHPLITCSHIFPPDLRGKVFPYRDENDQIRSFADLHQLKIRRPVTSIEQGAMVCLERNVKLHGSPSRSDLTVYSEALFDSLKPYDSRVLLSGFGGDQVVSSFAHGARDEMAEDGNYSGLWKELRATHAMPKASCRWLFWLLKSKHPIADQILDFYRRRKQPLLFNWRSLLQKLFITPDFAQEHGYPERHFNNPPWLEKGGVRKRELYLFNRATLTYRLEDSAVGAEFHGVEYRYPLLDKRLLEFCLALPSHQKYRSGVNRRMIRVSGKGILPDCIRNRRTKTGCGSTIPNANYRRVRDKEKFISSLHDMKSSLGDIPHSNWDKLIDYASKLTSQPVRGRSAVPRAFDKSYQVLFAQMNKI